MDKIRRAGIFDHYYFISPGSDYANLMWNDLSLVENVKYYSSPIISKNRFIQALHHLHFSFRLNKKIDLPLQKLWRNKYAVSDIVFSDHEKYCVIYTDISACRTDISFLEFLSKKQNITLIMTMANVVASKERLLRNRFCYFDCIYSWDKRDVEKYKQYGFEYKPAFFSKFSVPATGKDQSDCFFVGSSKGRLDILLKIFQMVTEKGGKAEFFITGVSKKDQKVKGIHYNKRIPYSLVQKKNASTNCIVEVIADNQVGQTMRTMEAIIGNKKLLTNNLKISENKYYNESFMRCFSAFDYNDVEFILEKKEVDYNYEYDCSPIKILDLIDKREKTIKTQED